MVQLVSGLYKVLVTEMKLHSWSSVSCSHFKWWTLLSPDSASSEDLTRGVVCSIRAGFLLLPAESCMFRQCIFPSTLKSCISVKHTGVHTGAVAAENILVLCSDLDRHHVQTTLSSSSLSQSDQQLHAAPNSTHPAVRQCSDHFQAWPGRAQHITLAESRCISIKGKPMWSEGWHSFLRRGLLLAYMG